MIRIALSDAAYDAIAATLPRAQPDGPCSATGIRALSRSRRLWLTACGRCGARRELQRRHPSACRARDDGDEVGLRFRSKRICRRGR